MPLRRENENDVELDEEEDGEDESARFLESEEECLKSDVEELEVKRMLGQNL